MTGNEERRADHHLEARLIVMQTEIAWFRSLDDATLQRIAFNAPPGSPEFEYATAELRRRVDESYKGHSIRA